MISFYHLNRNTSGSSNSLILYLKKREKWIPESDLIPEQDNSLKEIKVQVATWHGPRTFPSNSPSEKGTSGENHRGIITFHSHLSC